MNTVLKTFSIFFILLTLANCSPENNVSTEPATDDTSDIEMAMIIGQGNFIPSGHTSEGTAELVLSDDGSTYSLVFTDFRSSNGPALKVYLATDTGASDFIDLGDLKSTSGTLRYDFPSSDYQPRFTHVLIWCKEFSTLFGYAELTL